MRAWLVGMSAVFAITALAQSASELDRAYDEMLAAQTALQRAEAARAQGVEPLEGERLGTSGGQSRLGDAYWERQKRLDEEVERARQRLQQALERWNAVR